MRKLLWPLGLAAALTSPVSTWAQLPASSALSVDSPSASVLTLERTVDHALARNPSIAAAAKEVEAARGAAHQAGAWRNPELTTTLEDTRPETRITTVTLDIPLELGGKRSARIGVAERAVGVAEAELANVRAEVRARAIAAFFAMLVAQERMQLAHSSAALAARAADAVGKRVTAGKTSPVEELRARVDLANAQLESDEAMAEVQTARGALATTMGDTAPTFEAVQVDVLASPERPTLADLVAQLDRAPALLVGQVEVERRRALVDVERSKATSDLTLSIGSKRDATVGRQQAVVGFSIPLPLFDRNQGAILEASRRAAKAEDELQVIRLRLVGELQEASARLALASTSLRTLTQTVLPSARDAYDAASKGFDAGKFGFLDVIDAQRSLLQARSRYLNTLSAAYQAAAAIDRIAGR